MRISSHHSVVRLKAMAKYVPSSRHEGIIRTGGSDASDMDLLPAESQRLLDSPIDCLQVPGKTSKIGIKDGKIYALKIYAFKSAREGEYHGYPITGNEVYRKYPSAITWVCGKLGVSAHRLSRME
jgi:hypothetical protein